ncbi:hypothetical protein C2S53_009099 [Perilla frutescens var. hirtella]|uniref:TF-B3 domain-containing protein n=1 Tax=Perilla frutescens var. hirtella TaxID=608512 RepID=A0AAD4P972_PERFH|nr:hypothetical protein C2S53_009099 [Perilla frutescens var. hirtella]
MCRNKENDLICFDQGWPQFVDRHALTIGDLLLFELTPNDLHFNVTVFDSSACEKMFKEKEQANDALITAKMSSIGEAEKGIPYFEKTMVPHLATPRPSVVRFMFLFMY